MDLTPCGTASISLSRISSGKIFPAIFRAGGGGQALGEDGSPSPAQPQPLCSRAEPLAVFQLTQQKHPVHLLHIQDLNERVELALCIRFPEVASQREIDLKIDPQNHRHLKGTLCIPVFGNSGG